MKTREIIDLLAPQVASVLPGEGWCLIRGAWIVRTNGELMSGLALERSSYGPSFTVNLMCVPLYDPISGTAMGLSCRIGDLSGKGDIWWDFDRPDRIQATADDLTSCIQRVAVPFLNQATNEMAIIDMVTHNLFGDAFSISHVLLSGDLGSRSAFGFMAAWSGRRTLARWMLKPLAQEYADVRQTLALLGDNDQLRLHLISNAKRVRTELKLGTAPPLKRG